MGAIMIDMKITGYLNLEQLTQAVKNSVYVQTGMVVKSVQFDVSIVTEGYGMAEHDVTRLRGAHLEFEQNKALPTGQVKREPGEFSN